MAAEPQPEEQPKLLGAEVKYPATGILVLLCDGSRLHIDATIINISQDNSVLKLQDNAGNITACFGEGEWMSASKLSNTKSCWIPFSRE
jgi:hypothetical protein